MSREQPIVRAVIEAVNATGLARVWRNQSGTARGGKTHLAPPGSPDIVGFLGDGRFVGLEIKAPGARTGPRRARLQQEWQTLMSGLGCVCAQVTTAQQAVDVVLAAWRAREAR